MEKQLKYLLLLAAKLTELTEGLVEVCSQLADELPGAADMEEYEQPENNSFD